jgi:peptidoglycan hydrolase CwlO-like protein
MNGSTKWIAGILATVVIGGFSTLVHYVVANDGKREDGDKATAAYVDKKIDSVEDQLRRIQRDITEVNIKVEKILTKLEAKPK